MSRVSQLQWGMRLGVFKDRDAFATYAKELDFVVLPAHIVALAPSGASGFVAGSIRGVPFWVDPYTAAFSLPWDRLLSDRKNPTKGPRRSFLKLAGAYGVPFIEHVDRQQPLDIQTVARYVKPISDAVVAFQLNALRIDLEDDAEFFGLDTTGIRPGTLIAPYFPIARSNLELSIRTNLRLFEAAMEHASGLPVMLVLLLERSLLEDDSVVRSISSPLSSCSASLYGIWINDLDEGDCPSAVLSNYSQLVQALSASGGTVYNLHGGYFSGVLSYWGLGGFSHGPGYGESKVLDPPAGGFPTAKFYVPALHKRVVSDEIQDMLADGTGGLSSVLDLCDCPVCQRAVDQSFFAVYARHSDKEVRKGRPYPTHQTLINCRDHFLYARQREIAQLRSASYTEIHGQMLQASSQFPTRMSAHLSRWLEVLPKPQ